MVYAKYTSYTGRFCKERVACARLRHEGIRHAYLALLLEGGLHPSK